MFHFDGERPTERFVGLIFGWDGALMCDWVGFVDYTGVYVSGKGYERRERGKGTDPLFGLQALKQ